MFGKYTVTLSERAFRRIQRYALCVGASVDQVADYVVGEWMASTGDRIVQTQEAKERMAAAKLRLRIVYRRPSNRPANQPIQQRSLATNPARPQAIAKTGTEGPAATEPRS
jgi:hypothetical protein